MQTITPPLTPTARQTAADLRAIREQWGDLLAAIERPPAQEWPPREYRTVDIQAAALDDETPAEPRIGRLPLTLREHPAPINLDALDAAMQVEAALFTACDAIATRVQRPEHVGDPRLWRLPTVRDIGPANAAHAGSRAYGLHWAAVWLEGRALNEDTGDGDPFLPLPPAVLDDLARVARLARARVERALQRDGRPTRLDDPCPWCGGQLTAYTRSGDPHAATVVCATGEACGAPVPFDHGRRVWRGPDLTGLWPALDAARRRAG
ncbi:hypothetical protein QEP66_01020 [Streptomyces sp. LB8]|uniref:hypothetical protein n=1 Tax=Streptomyces sp. LB8 TaxID=3042509 RepID=UPI002647A6FF|nr:hypothetical protein [Streptomyces sp. LB8]MDN5380712.1 hypothetical protein [Streptomyces sp. LB8]